MKKMKDRQESKDGHEEERLSMQVLVIDKYQTYKC